MTNGDCGIESSIANERNLRSREGHPAEERETRRSVRIAATSENPSEQDSPRRMGAVRLWFATKFYWVVQNWTWSKIKPAIRCAVVGWISAILFVIPPVQELLGQASFLILIVAFFSPPSDPFLSVLERETLMLAFVAIGWAWACLGMFLANLTRRVHVTDLTISQVINGQYIEVTPTVILAVFLFFGSSFFLYIRARQGPGPYLCACVFGCLCVDVCLTTAALFPYPFYLIGKSIILPLALHTALSLLASLLLFPSTVSSLFTSRLMDIISPLLTTLTLHDQLLAMSLCSPTFKETLVTMRAETKQCEANLVPLAAAAHLLSGDLTYSRFSPAEFRIFQASCGRLAARADGMATYFSLVDPNRERIITAADKSTDGTPVPTAPPTPRIGVSRNISREPSLGPWADYQDRHQVDRSGLPPSSRHSVRSIASQITPPATPTRPTPTSNPHAKSRTHSLSRRFSSRNPFPSIFHAYPHLQVHSHHHHHAHHDLLHHSLLSLSKTRSKRRESAVGVFETQRYLNLEFMKFHDPDESLYTEKLMDSLRECSTPLLRASHRGLTTVSTWFESVPSGRSSHIRDSAILNFFGSGFSNRAKESEAARYKSHVEQLVELKKTREELANELQVFRNETRHIVLELYHSAFSEPAQMDPDNSIFGDDENSRDEDHDGHLDPEKRVPPHRYLFHCYIYQYHLIYFAGDVLEMLDTILRLEEERPWPNCSLWTPVENVFRWNNNLFAEEAQQVDDDDPDVIQGLKVERQTYSSPSQNTPTASPQPTLENDLGMPHKRDPDALPPRNAFEWIFYILHNLLVILGGGNVVFAAKAGLLTVVLSLPCLMKNTARLAFENRFVWVIFMGQLTLARFRGDTAFALIARLISTLGGGIVGLVMWYLSGDGNPYGLAAVCGVCFPFFFYARLYWPIPPMINLIFFVTIILVIGYSYQASFVMLPSLPIAGFTVAWRRFVLVSIGVSAAFIMSLFPPSTTIRKYQRILLSTTSSELGSVYCSILSYANTKNEPDMQEIMTRLIALRNKLKKSAALRANVGYEFSLRGRWPTDRYQKITDLQMAIAYSLSHLVSVIKHLEPSWALAFLRRTRFMDPDFQGDLLAVISMISSSLRTGCPLPQITPCPLIDRFTLKYHGLNVIHKEAEEDYGLPRNLTLDVLKNEQYLMFCVGISTAFGIVYRLDRLMIAVKEVVGEQYHIHGIGVPQHQSCLPVSPAISMHVIHRSPSDRRDDHGQNAV